MRLYLLFISLCLCSTLSAQGKILVVDAAGKPGTYRTIIAAVKAAKSGDQIRVRPGVYQGEVVIDGKSITLMGVGEKPSDVTISVRMWTLFPTLLKIRRVPKSISVTWFTIAAKPPS